MGGAAVGGLLRGLRTGAALGEMRDARGMRQRQEERQQVADKRAEEQHEWARQNAMLTQSIREMQIETMGFEQRNRWMQAGLDLIEAEEALAEGRDLTGDDFDRGADAIAEVLQPVIGTTADGERTEVANVVPGGQGLMLELDVTDKAGKQRRAPMTRDRSSRADDPVVMIPYQTVFGGIESIRERLNEMGYDTADPEARRLARLSMRAAYGDRAPLAEYRKEQRTRTADERKRRLDHETWVDRLNAEMMAKKEYAFWAKEQGISSQNQPSAVLTAEWLQTNMRGPNGERLTANQAWELSRAAVSRPDQFISSWMRNEQKALQDAGVQPGDPEWPTDDEWAKRGASMYETMRNAVYARAMQITEPTPGPGTATAAPTGAAAGGSPAAGGDFDPDAFLNGFGVPGGQ